MSNKDDYTASYDAFMAIPEEEVKYPGIPVDVFLQEAENLYLWCKEDIPLLIAAGLPEVFINAIPVRAGACREAQSLWVRERNTPNDAQKEWTLRSEAAYTLRDSLSHMFRYAFRNDEKLLARVAEITEGTGGEDMIQDLNDLSALGEKNPEPLVLINFDVNLLATAATLSDELAVLLATANGEKERGNVAKVNRDRAYTYLKQAVDEVKNCGRFVFWKNEARLKGYKNQYKNKHRKSSNNNDSE